MSRAPKRGRLIPLRHSIAAAAAPRRGLKMKAISIIATAAAVGLALALERGFAAGAGPFDGAWSV